MDARANAAVSKGSFDQLIFERDLNEVHLLIDFISGRPDRHVWELDVDIPELNQDGKKLSAFDLIEEVCLLRYPPQLDNPAERARDATMLLYAKDKLNTLAYPAKGLTIAYTYMFVAEQKALWFLRDTSPEQTRGSVARVAYPGLYPSAKRYRYIHRTFTYLGVVITICAALMLWYVTYGIQITSRFEDDRKTVSDLTAQIYAELNRESAMKTTSAAAEPPLRESVAQLCRGDALKSESNEINLLCNDWSYIQARYDKVIADACVFAIQGMSGWLIRLFPSGVGWGNPPAEVDQDGATPGGKGRGICISPPPAVAAVSLAEKGASNAAPAAALAPDSNRATQENIQSITLILSTYASYVLPVMFSVVGTIASMLRSVGDKITENVLAPRDETVALVRLPLGLMAGVAVGLFFSPTSVATQVSSGAGVLTLSASGIAFLAGYGAEGFFRMLDGLITNVFNLNGGEPQHKKDK